MKKPKPVGSTNSELNLDDRRGSHGESNVEIEIADALRGGSCFGLFRFKRVETPCFTWTVTEHVEIPPTIPTTFERKVEAFRICS